MPRGGQSLESAAAEVERIVDLTAAAVLPPGYEIASSTGINCNPLTAVGGKQAMSRVDEDLPPETPPPDLDQIEALWRDTFAQRVESLSTRRPSDIWALDLRLTDGTGLEFQYFVEAHSVHIDGFPRCF